MGTRGAGGRIAPFGRGLSARRASARALLSFAFFLACLLPLLLFGAAFLPTLSDHVAGDIASSGSAYLSTVETQMRILVFERPRSVLATILMLADSGEGRADDLAYLDRLLASFSLPREEYLSLLILSPSGKVLSAYDRAEPAYARPGSTYAMRAAPVAGDASFSLPFVLEGHLAVETSFANPRHRVVGLIDLGVVSSRLLLATRSQRDRAGVVDGSGYFVACSDPSRAMLREPLAEARAIAAGPFSRTSLRLWDRGVPYYAAFAPIGDSGWRAVYLSSVDEAEAPLRAFWWRLALIAAIGVASSGAIAIMLKRLFSEPLGHLVSRIGMIAAGRYEERVEPSPLAELEEIGVAFNAMAESIQLRDRDIQRSEERYRLLFLANRVPALLVQAEGARLRDANEAAAAYYGYGREELRRMALGDLDPRGPEALRADLEAAAGGAEGFSARHRLASGEMRDVEVYVGPMSIDEAPHYHAVVFDVTRRRVAEERMAHALDEKTLLLKEVYHRVKNNLQIISSLLSMQAGSSGDESLAIALRDAQDRVYAMSLVHELVYQVEDLSSIDAAEYASRLVLHAAEAYSVPGGRLALGLDPMELALERAIPFGLALNEILSNAFKYAGQGQIAVSLSAPPRRSEAARLSVADEGPGMRSGVLEGRSSTLGISLIRGLADQLHGEVSWLPGPGGKGTIVTLSFAPDEPPVEGGR